MFQGWQAVDLPLSPDDRALVAQAADAAEGLMGRSGLSFDPMTALDDVKWCLGGHAAGLAGPVSSDVRTHAATQVALLTASSS